MKASQRTSLLLLAILHSLLVLPCAQGLEYVRKHYTKYEYTIPMRDGVRLFTAVYVPKDRSQTYPILLNRTPYSVRPYGSDQYRENIGPSPLFARAGYIVAYQDVQRRCMSEGEFVHVLPPVASKSSDQQIDESTDTYNTIEWLVKNIHENNGKVSRTR